MNGTRLAMSLVLVAIPALAFPIVRKTGRPKWWAILLTASFGAGFVLLEVSLIHAALPVVFTLLGLRQLAAACRSLGGHLFGANPEFAGVALALAVTSGVGAIRGARATLRMHASLRIGSDRSDHLAVGGHDTILVPFSGAAALALPGASPRILVSESLVAALEARELSAVVRHEAAHLDHHHATFMIMGNLVRSGLWFVPWIRRSARSLTLALERWADEEASSESEDRRESIRSALRKLSQFSPSPMAGDRITALGAGTGHRARAALGWSAAASAVLPLAFALVFTLVNHLIQVIHVAGAAAG